MATTTLLNLNLNPQQRSTSQVLIIKDTSPRHEVKLDTASKSRSKRFQQNRNGNLSFKRNKRGHQKEKNYDRTLLMFNSNQRKIGVKTDSDLVETYTLKLSIWRDCYKRNDETAGVWRVVVRKLLRRKGKPMRRRHVEYAKLTSRWRVDSVTR